MKFQPPDFDDDDDDDPRDLVEGKRLRDAALDLHEDKNASHLQLARQIAKKDALRNNRVTNANRVRVEFERIRPEAWGSMAGAIFRGKAWKFTGKILPSEFRSRHAAYIREWEFVGEE